MVAIHPSYIVCKYDSGGKFCKADDVLVGVGEYCWWESFDCVELDLDDMILGIVKCSRVILVLCFVNTL